MSPADDSASTDVPGGAGPTRRRGVATKALLALITVYRAATAHRFPTCRFTPSCSEYASQALERFGARRGSALAVRRLLRCRPGGGFGYDPVPVSLSDHDRAHPSRDEQRSQ
ncbi:MAG: membrane protein insertion efficiency factor YidD [Acidimicrobiales bacterium]